MSLVEINWNPNRRQLRQFGVICLTGLPAAGWLWGANTAVMAWLGGLGAAAALLAWLAPALLKGPFLGLTMITWPIGLVVGEIAIGLIFFALVTPMGLLLRLLRGDLLQRRIDRDADSYWQPKAAARNVRSYYRQS